MAATTISPATKAPSDPVLEALHGSIPAQPLPLHYSLALFVVVLAMIALPAVYIGMIGFGGYLLYGKALIILGLGPAGVGGPGFWTYFWAISLAISILFLIKPLLAPPLKIKEPKLLNRQAEPRLFAFVERICKMVGAPMPDEIRVDCDVNASAGFGYGPFGILGNRMTLTIGLPLMAGLDVRQFAGVLAHEMGHFAQRTGMRLSYVVRSTNIWFLRVVFERDAWDQRLDDWSGNLLLALFVWPAKIIIKLGRFVLYLLMLAANALSCFLSRQMEFDADRYEAHIAGSDTFEQTSRRLRELSIASFGAQHDLSMFWDEGRLPDDLATLIVANAKQIPPKVLQSYDRAMKFRRTGFFDTHPSDTERQAAVMLLDTPGLYHPEDVADTAPAAEVKASAPSAPSQAFPSPASLKDPFSFDAAPAAARQKSGADPFAFGAAKPERKTRVNPFAFDVPPTPSAAPAGTEARPTTERSNAGCQPARPSEPPSRKVKLELSARGLLK